MPIDGLAVDVELLQRARQNENLREQARRVADLRHPLAEVGRDGLWPGHAVRQVIVAFVVGVHELSVLGSAHDDPLGVPAFESAVNRSDLGAEIGLVQRRRVEESVHNLEAVGETHFVESRRIQECAIPDALEPVGKAELLQLRIVGEGALVDRRHAVLDAALGGVVARGGPYEVHAIAPFGVEHVALGAEGLIALGHRHFAQLRRPVEDVLLQHGEPRPQADLEKLFIAGEGAGADCRDRVGKRRLDQSGFVEGKRTDFLEPVEVGPHVDCLERGRLLEGIDADRRGAAKIDLGQVGCPREGAIPDCLKASRQNNPLKR